MTPNGQNHEGESRLDRIERMIHLLTEDIVRMQAAQSVRDEEHRRMGEGIFKVEEALVKLADHTRAAHADFRQEHQLLLKAQVVLTDRMDKLADRMDKLAASQQHTDERLNALIGVVDGVVRRIPPE